MTYESDLDDGLARMRAWMTEHDIDARSLPDDPWKLPLDCPIWRMGLTTAQAGGILAAVRNGELLRTVRLNKMLGDDWLTAIEKAVDEYIVHTEVDPRCEECRRVMALAGCAHCGGPVCLICDRCGGCDQPVCARCDTYPLTPEFSFPGDRRPHPHCGRPVILP